MRTFFFLILLQVAAFTGFTQSDQADTKASAGMTWLGVDFSHVHIVGDYRMFETTPDFAQKINDLIYVETDKFDIAGLLKRRSVAYNVKYFEEKNKNSTPIEATKNPGFTDEKILEIVADNKPAGGSGQGAFFIAESLNKQTSEGIFHLVIVNLNDNKVIRTEKLIGEPRGFGLRNYWAGAIYDIIKDKRDQK